MPRTREEIQNELKPRIKAYEANNDPDSLFLYLEQQYGDHQTDEEEEFISEVITEYMGDLDSSEDPIRREFSLNLERAFEKRITTLSMLSYEKSEEMRTQLENDEIEGSELYSANPHAMNDVAQAYVRFRTPFYDIFRKTLGAKNQINDGRVRETDHASQRIIDSYRRRGRDEVFAHYPYDRKVMDKFVDEFSSQVSASVTLDSVLSKSTYSTLDVNNQNGGFVFDQEEAYLIRDVRAMSDVELGEKLAQLKNESEQLQTYEDSANAWRSTARALREELNQNTSEEDKQQDAYKELDQFLKSSGNIGGFFQVKKTDGSTLTAANYPFNHISALCNDLKSSAAQYGGDLGDRISKAAGDALANITESYHKGADKVYEKYANRERCSNKILKTDIATIEKEQQLRTMRKDQAGMSELKKLNSDIGGLIGKKDEIALFKQKLQYITGFTDHDSSLLKSDSDQRGLRQRDRSRHKEYMDLTDKTQALTTMDPDKMTSDQIFQTIRDAKQAADQYLATHVGKFTKGWTKKGRARIEYARRLSQTLAEQMDRLAPEEDKLKNTAPGNKTLGEWHDSWDAQKTKFREQAKELRTRMAVPIPERIRSRAAGYELEAEQHKEQAQAGRQGTIMETAARTAAESVRALDKLAESKVPFTDEQKKEITSHIARTVVYDNESLGEDRRKNKNADEYKNYVQKLADAPSFNEAVRNAVGDLNPENLRKFTLNPSMSKTVMKEFTNARAHEVDAMHSRQYQAAHEQPVHEQQQPAQTM